MTFDFVCNKCGFTKKLFLRGKENEIKELPCEKCLGTMIRMIGAGGGCIFKGDGFYSVDYRKDNKK